VIGRTALALAVFVLASATSPGARLFGQIVDAETGLSVPARLYIQSADGKWHHAFYEDPIGTAQPFHVKRGLRSVETHTILSGPGFVAELEPGRYTVTAERGKEYHLATADVEVGEDGAEVTLKLRRWTNMAAKGWFSGETHVHRKVTQLPTVMLAEDLNVALPLTAWVTDSREAPSLKNKNPDPVPPPKLIEVDKTHVIWPVNTEYEIFTVDGKGHTLGAVFILNHKEPFPMTAPPVVPIAKEARRQGALLDLDKHNWPWSMMVVQQMGVGLYELTNNHVWRTQFMFSNWYTELAADYMGIEKRGGHFTERGWIDFGFQNYYALLNCGFDIKPTGGTASGVHPVPLGFGRVYVKIDGEFSYQKWIDGLAAGRSFVTTGPMLVVDAKREGDRVKLSGEIEAGGALGGIEVIVNGEIKARIAVQPELTAKGSFRVRFEHEIELESSSWVAVRAFEAREDRRPRFAHTAPMHFKVEGKPLRPREVEVRYLMKRVADELKRHEGVLKEEALAEYRAALAHYESLLEGAR
jgi:hypothetical protein